MSSGRGPGMQAERSMSEEKTMCGVRCRGMRCGAVKSRALVSGCNAIQHHAIEYNRMQRNRVRLSACNAIQHHAIECNRIQYNTIVSLGALAAVRCGATESRALVSGWRPGIA